MAMQGEPVGEAYDTIRFRRLAFAVRRITDPAPQCVGAWIEDVDEQELTRRFSARSFFKASLEQEASE
jgi:hypothetical protein